MKRVRIYTPTRHNMTPVDPKRCAANVDGYIPSQCLRKGRYEHGWYRFCSQHLKMVETDPKTES
jgi:hypothetical protein